MPTYFEELFDKFHIDSVSGVRMHVDVAHKDTVFAMLVLAGGKRTSNCVYDMGNTWLMADFNEPANVLLVYPNTIRLFYQQRKILIDGYP